MIWLSSSTLVRLRDQLKTRGQRPSVLPPPGISVQDAELVQIVTEYGPLCEAMYLMMSADGHVSNEEREVLRGALRNLSEDNIRSAHMESMLDNAGKKVAEDGRDKRMEAVISELREDPARAEVAFVLAAAVAFADGAIADAENDTLNAFAEGLGIDEPRANELLDEVEQDLSREEQEGKTPS